MPSIDAPTVAAHRARQRDALLDAAEALLREGGHTALSFAAIGRRTGLARNSVYRYFTDTDDVIAALCERDLPAWLAEIEAAMASSDSPDARVRAFVDTQMRLVAEGGHRMAELLGSAPLGPDARSRINALAWRPARLLEPDLEAAGEPDPALTAQLVQGIVNAGVRLLHRPGDAAAVRERTASLTEELLRTRRTQS